VTLRTNSISIRGRSFTVSELTAKQMGEVRKAMKEQPHDADLMMASLGSVEPKMTFKELAEEPNIFAKRMSAEILRLSDEDPDEKKADAPALT
jgi:hypothetical protein